MSETGLIQSLFKGAPRTGRASKDCGRGLCTLFWGQGLATQPSLLTQSPGEFTETWDGLLGWPVTDANLRRFLVCPSCCQDRTFWHLFFTTNCVLKARQSTHPKLTKPRVFGWRLLCDVICTHVRAHLSRSICTGFRHRCSHQGA